jgi:hypothetical protein
VTPASHIRELRVTSGVKADASLLFSENFDVQHFAFAHLVVSIIDRRAVIDVSGQRVAVGSELLGNRPRVAQVGRPALEDKSAALDDGIGAS